MALWGDRDNFQSVAVGVATVGLSTNSIEIEPGPFAAGVGTDSPFIYLGLGNTCGFAQIVSVSSTSVVTIASTDALVTDAVGAIAGVAYSLSTAPIYLDKDPLATQYAYGGSGLSTVTYFGVGPTALAQGYGDGINGPVGLASTSVYRPAHAGWVGVQTYTDNHGNLRVKSEVLVAMSGIHTGNGPYPNYKA